MSDPLKKQHAAIEKRIEAFRKQHGGHSSAAELLGEAAHGPHLATSDPREAHVELNLAPDNAAAQTAIAHNQGLNGRIGEIYRQNVGGNP